MIPSKNVQSERPQAMGLRTLRLSHPAKPKCPAPDAKKWSTGLPNFCSNPNLGPWEQKELHKNLEHPWTLCGSVSEFGKYPPSSNFNRETYDKPLDFRISQTTWLPLLVLWQSKVLFKRASVIATVLDWSAVTQTTKWWSNSHGIDDISNG